MSRLKLFHSQTRPDGAAVDPEIKKQLDKAIHDARQALDEINVEADGLAAEERTIRAEDAQYKKKYVGSLFLLPPCLG